MFFKETRFFRSIKTNFQTEFSNFLRVAKLFGRAKRLTFTAKIDPKTLLTITQTIFFWIFEIFWSSPFQTDRYRLFWLPSRRIVAQYLAGTAKYERDELQPPSNATNSNTIYHQIQPAEAYFWAWTASNIAPRAFFTENLR